MTASEALEQLLRSYETYYDVERTAVTPPFAAEAAFHSHDEMYFLVKRARIAESEAHEYVFFAVEDALTLERARALDEAAWAEGMSRVRPHPDHRSTDVILVVLAETIEPEAAEFLRSLRRSKSYKFNLYGFSTYRVIALETSSGSLTCNRRGRDLRKLFRNIQIS